jgi:hypothetical protein
MRLDTRYLNGESIHVTPLLWLSHRLSARRCSPRHITDLFAFSKTVREARVLVETVVEDSSGVSLRSAVDARV